MRKRYPTGGRPLQLPGTRGPGDAEQSILALQHGVGNRGVAQLLRRKKSPIDPAAIDAELPAGASAADPLPAVAALPGAATATITADAAVGGGWTEAGGKQLSSGRVGKIDRILLEGITGRQVAQEKLSNVDSSGAGYARAVGQGKRGKRGRAVALVPQAMRAGTGGETVVIVHFHGVDVDSGMLGSAGMRGANDPKPEDVGDFQLPQQVEAHLKSRPGARVIVLMPVGVTLQDPTSLLKDTFFGLADTDTFVDDSFAQLATLLPTDTKPGTVYLSGHSGGGFEIERLIGGNRQPKKYRFGGVFGFETVHAKHAATWGKLATDHLDADLGQLQKLKDPAAQLAYLRDSGFRFTVFGGYGGYKTQTRAVRRAILDWFARNEAKIKAATGGDQKVLDQLWSNYQAQFFAGSTHMNALSHDSNFGRALAALPP